MLALLDPAETGFQYDLGEVLIERARALRPLLARHAATHEANGELMPEVVDAIRDAQLFIMSAPRRWGGLCITSEIMSNVSRELAKGCPSTAWIVSIVNSNVWVASTMSPTIQETLFGNGIPLITGPSNGMGTLEKRDGKFFVSGKWAYGSASHHAEWAMVPAMSEDGQVNMVALRMSDVVIENSWQVTGMKGTGSDTVVAADVEIAEEQFCQISSKSVGVALDQSTYIKEPTDYWVGFPLLRAKALGVLLGTVEGLLESVIECKDRPIIYSTYTQRGNSAQWQAGIGEAAARIGVARLIADKHNHHNDIAAAAGRTLTYAERAICRGECAVAADLLIRSVDDLMDLAGSSAFALKTTSQRYWRDFSIGIRHVIFNSKLGYEVFGKQILDISPNVAGPDHI